MCSTTKQSQQAFPLFVSDECVSKLVTVAPPVSADVGGDCIGAVQSDAAVGEVTQTTEHGLEVRDLFLQRETVREMMREGRGGEGRGAEGRGKEEMEGGGRGMEEMADGRRDPLVTKVCLHMQLQSDSVRRCLGNNPRTTLSIDV